MTAAEYVGLAKRVTRAELTDPITASLRAKFGLPRELAVWDSGQRHHGWGRRIRRDSSAWRWAVMRIEPSPESTASEEALTRALLASAITTGNSGPTETPYGNKPDCWASLGDQNHGALDAGGYATEAEARDALLDSLLAEAAAK